MRPVERTLEENKLPETKVDRGLEQTWLKGNTEAFNSHARRQMLNSTVIREMQPRTTARSNFTLTAMLSFFKMGNDQC